MKRVSATVFCSVLALFAQGVEPPRLVIQEGRAGFVDEAGRVLASPRYARVGVWSEGRIWVQEHAETGAPGTFLDERANPVAPARFRDLSAVRPELPMPAFDRGVAVVGLAEGGFGYVNRAGALLGRTTSAGAFQRQDDPLLLVVEQGLQGYIDRQGAVKIPTRFEEARPFRGGRAAARAGARWGLLDESGSWVVEPSFDAILPVQGPTGLWAFRLEGRWGLLNEAGRRLTDAAYEAIGSSRDGVVAAKAADGWGLVAADGALRAAPRYEALAPLGEAAGFWAAQGRNGKWGVVAANGLEIAACGFDIVDAPAPEIWTAARSGSWGVLDPEKGTWRLAPVFERILPLAPPFAGSALVEQRGRWGVADAATGRMTLKTEQSGIRQWGDHLAVEKGSTLQLLDRAGTRTLEWAGRLAGLPPYETLREGLGVLRFEGGATLVTDRGEMPWTEAFDDAGDWSGGVLAVRRDGRWGYVRRDGAWRIQPTFTAAGAFAEGVAPASDDDGRWGLIDEAGAWRAKPAFEGMGAPWRGRVPAMRGGRWGLVDFDGNEVLDCVYDGLEWGSGETGEIRFHGTEPDLIPGLDGYGGWSPE